MCFKRIHKPGSLHGGQSGFFGDAAYAYEFSKSVNESADFEEDGCG